MPNGIVLATDVDVRGAVFVGESQFGLVQRGELGIRVVEEVAAFLLGGVLWGVAYGGSHFVIEVGRALWVKVKRRRGMWWYL